MEGDVPSEANAGEINPSKGGTPEPQGRETWQQKPCKNPGDLLDPRESLAAVPLRDHRVDEAPVEVAAAPGLVEVEGLQVQQHPPAV